MADTRRRGGDVGNLAVVESEVSRDSMLAEMAGVVMAEHGAAQKASVEAVRAAIRAGETLLKMRDQFPRGGWADWCAEHLAISPSMVSLYIRLARFQEVVLAEGVTGVKQASRLLVGLPDATPRGTPVLLPEAQERVKTLLSDGMSKRATAELLGVSERTIRGVVDPEGERRRKRVAATNRRERLKQQADVERQTAIKRAVRKAGAAEQELYAMCERMQDVLGQAHREATDPEKRRHYALMGEHYRKMRDEGVRALGIL